MNNYDIWVKHYTEGKEYIFEFNEDILRVVAIQSLV